MDLVSEESLIEFGMTPTEAKVYLEVIKLGESKIGPIIKRTGLHRGTVYTALDDLIKKGFATFIDEEKSRNYKVSGKNIFNSIIKERKNQAGEQEKIIDKFFNEIEKIQNREKRQNVRVYYGVPAFKTLFLEVYEECKKNDCEYYFQGMGGEMQDATGEAFYNHTQKLKNKMKIKSKIILDKKTKPHSYHKVVQGNLRYIDSDRNSPVNIWIYGDIVLLVLFGTNPLISIKIESKITSEAFKGYFEKLWKMAK